ncbi:unnamed protein product [Acanthoscelides obtectus]|uniref:Uncharacterized protein n=1 Tax=Acanthoscelides obtectus TaxID=200917 RepID=A0A9P0PQ44_ACAOB|nr:unnamed protein product [Acanthoscelides obtectus]CAK1680689.1 hypothetical protein AOBTE_LOCUS32841 [Acanthoscelides obtectus]
MVLHVSNEKLDVFEEPIIDHSLASLQEYTYKPYGSPYFKNSDIVHILINFQDLILNIADSYIYAEGTFTPSDATKPCYLSNIALAFLFQEISLQMGGEKGYGVWNPGITSTIKTMIPSHGAIGSVEQPQPSTSKGTYSHASMSGGSVRRTDLLRATDMRICPYTFTDKSG